MSDDKYCCDNVMTYTPLQTMNMDEDAEIWICLECFSFIEYRSGQMDQDAVMNCLGLDTQDIENYDTLTDDELTLEIRRLLDERKVENEAS